MMKVCIVNNQRFLKMNKHQKTLDKNKKTLIVEFRCWHYHKQTDKVCGNCLR